MEILAFILVVLLLGCMPAEADPLYDGFIVSPWVYEGITYYRVYSNPEEIMGAPTFYTEERETSIIISTLTGMSKSPFIGSMTGQL